MLGVIHRNNVVTLVGASYNFPTVDLVPKDFDAEERRLRKRFLGSRIWSLDEKIQKRVVEENQDVLQDLTSEELELRARLGSEQWAVFRLGGTHQMEHPTHWEPECRKYPIVKVLSNF
jgi:hypothetical protein